MEAHTGEIYVITNDINDYVYVGKTYTGYMHRFYQHKFSATAKDEDGNFKFNTKIYKAMREIGVEHFSVECLGRFPTGDLEEAEQFYIEQFNSFVNGYNSNTGGGCGKKNIISQDTEEEIIVLKKDFNLSISKIGNILGLSEYAVGNIVNNLGLGTPNSVKHKMETIEDEVYGVQRKTGHIVSFKNSYIAAKEIYDAGLSVQDPYYIRNDIRRSIESDKYGVAGYIWFNNIVDAQRYYDHLTEKHRYTIEGIPGSRLTKAVLIKTKRQEKRNNSKEIHNNNEDWLSGIDNTYPPSKEILSQLILSFTVNRIAAHYKVSFNSMKDLLRRSGLPYTKDAIHEYKHKYIESLDNCTTIRGI